MKKLNLSLATFLVCLFSFAQKKPLDHSVYDGWQSIGERLISNDGKFVVYAITPQEGDVTLYIQKSTGEKIAVIERGYNAKITEDNKYVVCKIKPTYQQTRAARIAKKSVADMPKDSLAIIEVASANVQKIANVRSYKLPEKNSNVLFYLMERNNADSNNKRANADTARVVANATTNAVAGRRLGGGGGQRGGGNAGGSGDDAGNDLIVVDLSNQSKKTYRFVTDYLLSKNGNTALLKAAKRSGDSLSVPSIVKLTIQSLKADTILKNFNDAKGFAFDEDS